MKPSSAPKSTPSARADKSTQDNAKILPPGGPVDVPNLPDKPDADTPDEAARDKREVVDNKTESNWADGSAPQPRAKNARSSIF
ncbi:hypothetical protein [Achromobacter spanius]|uniref:Uncharacterized protein n=1 Tax=Achromobacter spanius TaxID=217203 RepID=A0A2S0I7R1_9BURK|nr:hypothetical protein [Achromobacter spanius]AVJ28061.1 hypothetical protein CLM73_13555 [Achromobacter spanius]